MSAAASGCTHRDGNPNRDGSRFIVGWNRSHAKIAYTAGMPKGPRFFRILSSKESTLKSG